MLGEREGFFVARGFETEGLAGWGLGEGVDGGDDDDDGMGRSCGVVWR